MATEQALEGVCKLRSQDLGMETDWELSQAQQHRRDMEQATVMETDWEPGRVKALRLKMAMEQAWRPA